jgi:hypothetical protein
MRRGKGASAAGLQQRKLTQSERQREKASQSRPQSSARAWQSQVHRNSPVLHPTQAKCDSSAPHCSITIVHAASAQRSTAPAPPAFESLVAPAPAVASQHSREFRPPSVVPPIPPSSLPSSLPPAPPAPGEAEPPAEPPFDDGAPPAPPPALPPSVVPPLLSVPPVPTPPDAGLSLSSSASQALETKPAANATSTTPCQRRPRRVVGSAKPDSGDSLSVFIALDARL